MQDVQTTPAARSMILTTVGDWNTKFKTWWWRSIGIHTRWSTGMFLSFLQGPPFEVTSSDKKSFRSLEFSICNFILIVWTFIHIKPRYFINALHMFVLNQFIRIHYFKKSVLIYFHDIQLSTKKLKAFRGRMTKMIPQSLQYAFEQTPLTMYKRCFKS